MSNLIHSVVHNNDEALPNQKVTHIEEWLFMESPIPVLSILGVYLVFVLKTGPKMMENRAAYSLSKALVAYNLFQIGFSIWLTAQGRFINFGELFASKGCHLKTHQTAESMDYMVRRAAWWYFIAKLSELLDTIFFVLRKKQTQVTFLHVYHHTLMALGSWMYTKYLPGTQGALIGFVNSFVHIVMYTYYLVSALGPRYQKYLRLKKYITWLQLIQFGLILFYAISILALDCPMPKPFSCCMLINAVIFTYLFVDFYRKSYKRKQV